MKPSPKEPTEYRPERTLWFSFGQAHAHRVNGKTFDCDCLVEITAPDPEKVMFETFGDKWGMEYDEAKMKKSLHYYKRGIIKL